MRKRLYDFIKSPAGGKSKTTVYDYFMMIVIIVSLCTEAPSESKIQGLVFGTATPEQKAATRASWNGWDVFHTAIIICITIAFYWYFW